MSYLTYKDLLSMSLDDIIRCKNIENIENNHYDIFENLPYKTDVSGGTLSNKEVIKFTDKNATLYDWKFKTSYYRNSNGYKKKVYKVIGYLYNERCWQTSEIKKIKICFNELLGYYLRVKTNSKYHYNLPLLKARYTKEYLNVFHSSLHKKDFSYHPTRETQVPENKQFTIKLWEIVNKGGGFYLIGNKYFNNEYINTINKPSFEMRITSIIFHSKDKVYMELRTVYGDSYKLYYDDSYNFKQKFEFN